MRTKTVFFATNRRQKTSFFVSCGIFLITRGRLFHTLGAWLNSAVVGKAAKKRRGTTHALASTGTFCVSSFLPEFAKTRFFDAQHFFCAKTRLLLLPLLLQHASRLEGLFTQLDSSRKISKSAHTVHPVRRIRDEQKSPPKSHEGEIMICGSQIHTDCKEHL